MPHMSGYELYESLYHINHCIFLRVVMRYSSLRYIESRHVSRPMFRRVHGNVLRHVSRHVVGHVFRHVFRHVCGNVFRRVFKHVHGPTRRRVYPSVIQTC